MAGQSTGNLAHDLWMTYSPRDPHEKLLVRELIWAAVQLEQLMEDAPAEPDVKWMRLFALADRVFQRNHRLLQKAGVYRQPTHGEAPKSSNAPAQAAEPATIPPPTPKIPATPLAPASSSFIADLFENAAALAPELIEQLADASDPVALLKTWDADGLDPEVAAFWIKTYQRPEPHQNLEAA